MKAIPIIFVLSVLIVALATAGCLNKSTTPAVTATPVPTATKTPTATLIGNTDEAHVQFFYSMGTQSDYGGLQKASKGNLLYIFKVNVSSDKPIQTSLAWFGAEYKVNDTDAVHDTRAFNSYVTFPEKTIGPGLSSARGEILAELPDHMAEGYPKIYYWLPLNQQQGPYKVYDKVYGVPGDVQ
jgi:hypothetical protein